MRQIKLFIIVCLCFVMSSIQAQNNSQVIKVESSSTFAVKLGKTAPVRNLAKQNGVDLAKKDAYKKRFKAKTIPNFNGRGIPANSIKDAQPLGMDPVRQTEVKSASNFIVEPFINVDGMQTGAAGNPSPPDPDGAIGKDYYVQMVNATAFQVFDKTDGSEVSGIISMNTIWAGMGVTSLGDPIVFFDQEHERWIITEFNGSGNALLIAVSETSDPLGSYFTYEFSTPQFPDYPKYSLWTNAVVVTSNEGGSGQEFYVIDRAALIAGEDNVNIQRHVLPTIPGSPGFFVATPVDWIGSAVPPVDAKPMVIRMNDDAWGDSPIDLIEIFEIDIDWSDATNTVVTQTDVETAAYDSNPCSVSGPGFSCIPQLNGGGIDGLQEVIMNQVKYRNFGSYEAIVLCFIVDYTGGDNTAGIRWMELRRSGGAGWTVYQEGTFAPDDGLDRFIPSIAMDVSGNIGLAYSISSENIHPGLAYTGRRSSDPLGEMTVEEYIIVEGNGIAPNSRYGDYSCMTVDPIDERGFWFTAEYMKTSSGWGTMITAFELGRDTFDIGPSLLNTPMSSNDLGPAETVSVTVKNYGIESVESFDISCYLDGAFIATETVNQTLASDEEYVHTFVPTVDLSALGFHEFEIITDWDEDTANFNDTLRTTVSHELDYDAAILSVDSDVTLVCGTSVELDVVLANGGFELLESVVFNVFVNGDPSGAPINWTGALAFGESETVTILVEGLVDGTAEIEVVVSEPNGQVDEDAANDSGTRTVDVTNAGASIFLNLTTDGYPGETTWEIVDENDVVIYSGGPYNQAETTFNYQFCVEDDACYTFKIYDSWGDGLDGGFFYDDGDYEILDEDGNVLASLIEVNFGDFEFNEFCAGAPCLLSAIASTTAASGSDTYDGTMQITVANGVAPFTYSIDGGQTFSDEDFFVYLLPGLYDVVVVDANGCSFEFEVEIAECMLAAEFVVTNETVSGEEDGSIEVNTTGAMGGLEFSIDGGQTWQSSNIFSGLGFGEYFLAVQDSEGCIVYATVIVEADINSVTYVYSDMYVEIKPNPTMGVFIIDVHGVDQDGLYLPIQILDASGKIVYNVDLVWYDDMYTSQISIFEEPAGMYFIRFKRSDIKRMVKLIKL